MLLFLPLIEGSVMSRVVYLNSNVNSFLISLIYSGGIGGCFLLRKNYKLRTLTVCSYNTVVFKILSKSRNISSDVGIIFIRLCTSYYMVCGQELL